MNPTLDPVSLSIVGDISQIYNVPKREIVLSLSNFIDY